MNLTKRQYHQSIPQPLLGRIWNVWEKIKTGHGKHKEYSTFRDEFLYEKNQESEVEVWEAIANAYEQFWKRTTLPKEPQLRKAIFGIILGRSLNDSKETLLVGIAKLLKSKEETTFVGGQYRSINAEAIIDLVFELYPTNKVKEATYGQAE